jgi:site-specific recombinase XerD
MTNELIQVSKDLNLSTFSESPEELVWFENLTSKYTAETYKHSLMQFCKLFNIKNVDELQNVKTIHIIKFRNFLQESNLSKATINTRLSSLSSLFKHLIENQKIVNDPTRGVKRMRKDYQKVKSRILDDWEVEAMMNQPKDDKLIGLRDKAILSIMFNAGTRVGTIARMTGKDIYEENGYFVIDMHLKGGKRNKVAVNSCIYANVKSYFEKMNYLKQDGQSYQESREGRVKFNIADDLPIFPQMSNNPKMFDISKPIGTKNLYKMWQKYAKKADIERTNPHCARATFATKALASGCNLQHVQHTLGHGDPRTTMSYNKGEAQYKNSASLRVSFG